ncbi:MAG: hypothetical protein K6A34_01185 [Methanobrevibacter sp.]|nr:hypothetical protein [Methanobrevibacter sp.]
MKRNKSLAREVVTFQDLGYMLAPSQADLTVKQKLFLMKAVPLVREEQEKEQEKGSANTGNIKDRIRQKKQEMS